MVPDPGDPDTLWLALPSLQRVGQLRYGHVVYPYGTGEAWFAGDGGDAARAAFDRPSSFAFDETGAIGRRYRRQDEAGTPYCFTVDGQTLEDGTVTVRDRKRSRKTHAIDVHVER